MSSKGHFEMGEEGVQLDIPSAFEAPAEIHPLKIALRKLHPDEILDTMKLIDFDAPAPEKKPAGPRKGF